MMREVGRPNMALCLDVPLFKERQGDAYIREAVRACAPHIRLTHYGAWNFRESADGEPIQEHGPSYDGTINDAQYLRRPAAGRLRRVSRVRSCLPCVKDNRIAGIDEIDRATALALRYMKQLVMVTGAV